MEKVPFSAIGMELDLTDLVEVERIEGGRRGRVKTHPSFARKDDLAVRGVGAPMMLFGGRQGGPATALRAVLHPVPTDSGFWSSVIAGTELVVLDGDRQCGRAVVEWTAPLARGISQVQLTALVQWSSRGGEPPQL
jgi:hypothetical protein